MNGEEYNILLIDDDEEFITKQKELLGVLGNVVVDCGTTEEEFYQQFRPGKYNCILLDLRLRRSYEGMELLQFALQKDPSAPVIVITAYSSVETAVRSLKLGAKDYIQKENIDDKTFMAKVNSIIIEDKANKISQQKYRAMRCEQEIPGQDSRIVRIRQIADFFAENRQSPILLMGAYGTEKSEIAEYIYQKGVCTGPFIQQGLIPEKEDVDDILFGSDDSFGLLQKASQGVLFLDEIFNLPSATQKKLHEFIRDSSYGTPAQLILGTSRTEQDVLNDTQTEPELYYTAKTCAITIPPLALRGDDILFLANYHLSALSEKEYVTAYEFSEDVEAELRNYSWPGNTMELKQVVEYAAFKATLDSAAVIQRNHLPFELQEYQTSPNSDLDTQLDIERMLADTALKYIQRALQKTEGRKIKAGELLGYSRRQRQKLPNKVKKIFRDYPDLADRYPDVYSLFLERGN